MILSYDGDSNNTCDSGKRSQSDEDRDSGDHDAGNDDDMLLEKEGYNRDSSNTGEGEDVLFVEQHCGA
jgi:hypothetical protein